MSGSEGTLRPRRSRGMWWLVPALATPMRLSEVRGAIGAGDGEVNPSDAAWACAVRAAMNDGLITVAGDSADPLLTRTPFGDAWAVGRDHRGALSGGEPNRYPPGPGRFGLDFYPLSRRPTFDVYAMAGGRVTETRQGLWNLEHGNGGEEPNPVTEVTMHATIDNGPQTVWVQSEPHRFGLAALRTSQPGSFPAVMAEVMAALAARAEPWRPTPVEVDRTALELLRLHLDSPRLPVGLVGPPLLIAGRIGTTEVTIGSLDPFNGPIRLTKLAPADLLGPDKSLR